MASLMLLKRLFLCLTEPSPATTSALSDSGSVSFVGCLGKSSSSTRLDLLTCEFRCRLSRSLFDREVPSPRRSESATTALSEEERGVIKGAGVSRAMLLRVERVGVVGWRRAGSAFGGLAVLLDLVGVSRSAGPEGVRRRVEDWAGRLGPVVAGV
jgi:hypothetical protein